MVKLLAAGDYDARFSLCGIIVKAIYMMINDFAGDLDKKIFRLLIGQARYSILWDKLLRDVMRRGINSDEFFSLEDIMIHINCEVLSFMISISDSDLFDRMQKIYEPGKFYHMPTNSRVIQLCSQNGNLNVIKKVLQQGSFIAEDNIAFKIAYLSVRYNVMGFYLTLPVVNPHATNMMILMRCGILHKKIIVIIFALVIDGVIERLLC
uniref:Uncharacterized protein n=1 Tax=viral metagenome TaxID=1070528 RepID=A0A6C0CA29_9ZZZZ